jgi:hypothetical protein
MKAALTIADIGNCIEALHVAIEDLRCLIDSNMPPGSHGKKQRKAWTQEERDDYNEWSDQIKRFSKLRKKLLAIEKDA